MNFDKLNHDFGNVRNNTTVYTQFKYLGDEFKLQDLTFTTSCGCTGVQTDLSTNTVTTGINVQGDKFVTITVGYPNGTKEYLNLKAKAL